MSTSGRKGAWYLLTIFPASLPRGGPSDMVPSWPRSGAGCPAGRLRSRLEIVWPARRCGGRCGRQPRGRARGSWPPPSSRIKSIWAATSSVSAPTGTSSALTTVAPRHADDLGSGADLHHNTVPEREFSVIVENLVLVDESRSTAANHGVPGHAGRTIPARIYIPSVGAVPAIQGSPFPCSCGLTVSTRESTTRPAAALAVVAGLWSLHRPSR